MLGAKDPGSRASLTGTAIQGPSVPVSVALRCAIALLRRLRHLTKTSALFPNASLYTPKMLFQFREMNSNCRVALGPSSLSPERLSLMMGRQSLSSTAREAVSRTASWPQEDVQTRVGERVKMAAAARA